MQYLALLRGINVGGKAKLPMAELKACMEKSGFENVKTYIQSGNVFFDFSENSETKIIKKLEDCIQKNFQLNVPVALFTKDEWKKIIEDAPTKWGKDAAWKHNLLVLLKPYDMNEALSAIGELKPEIESIQAGEGVLYQSMSRELFGKTTTGKLASNPIYKRMTVRNFNTSTKLLSLFD